MGEAFLDAVVELGELRLVEGVIVPAFEPEFLVSLVEITDEAEPALPKPLRDFATLALKDTVSLFKNISDQQFSMHNWS
jgi:hypothetical protein